MASHNPERGVLQISFIGFSGPLVSLVEYPAKTAQTQWYVGTPSISYTTGQLANNEISNLDTGIIVYGNDFGDSQGTGIVEIGDSSVYASANKVTQTVTAWTDNQITITASLGAQSPGEKYLFVTDGSGNVSPGREILVHRATAFNLKPSANISAGAVDATTNRLTVSTGTFVAGERSDDTNPTPTVSYAAGQFSEWEYSLTVASGAIGGQTYEFRIVGVADDGTIVPLDTYSVTPSTTISSGSSVNIGLTTEADTAFSVTPSAGAVSVSLGLSTETDTAFAVTVSTDTSVAIGLSSETDTAFAISASPGDPNLAFGLSGETDTAFSITPSAGAATVNLGLAVEADTAFNTDPSGGAVSVSIGLSTETDTSFTITPNAGYFKFLDQSGAAAASNHNINITGVTPGADVWLVVTCAATITTPAGWGLETSYVNLNATYVYRLPGASNPGGTLPVALALAASRSIAWFAFQAPLITGTPYESLVTPGNTSGTAFGTTLHTFTSKHNVLAIFDWFTGSTPVTYSVSSYDFGFSAFASTGWYGSGVSGDEAVSVIAGFVNDIGFTSNGVTVTVDNAIATTGSVGFLAFDDTGTIAPVIVIGQASESDTAFSITPSIDTQQPIGLSNETDTAFDVAPVGGAVSVTLGLAVETDTAFNISTTNDLSQPVGLATETDIAFTFTISVGDPNFSFGLSTETDTAFVITPSPGDPNLAIGLAIETDSAFTISAQSAGSLTISFATETDTSFSITPFPGAVTVICTGTDEFDSALPITVSVGDPNLAVGLAVETDTAFTISPQTSGSVAIGQAIETDTAFSITPTSAAASVPVGLSSETDTAFDIQPSAGAISVAVGLVTESDTAFSITATAGVITGTINLATEADTAFVIVPIGGASSLAIGIAIETDSAFTFITGDPVPPRYNIIVVSGVRSATTPVVSGGRKIVVSGKRAIIKTNAG